MDCYFYRMLDRLMSSDPKKKKKKKITASSESKTTHLSTVKRWLFRASRPHPLPLPLCRFSGSPGGPLCRAGASVMDPLMARGYHNLHCSPLGRLPEELLVHILRLLRCRDLVRLRRVSRLFLRLYEARDFDILLPGSFDGDLPWKTPPYYRFHGLRAVAEPLARDMDDCCGDCRRARRQLRYPWRFKRLTRHMLFCSGCRLHHPRHLFSGPQRDTSDESRRVCIAHEGAVRLCSHRSVRLADVIATARREMECHRQPDGRLRSSVRTRAVVCDHPSHQPDHQGKARPAYRPGETSCPTLHVVVDARPQKHKVWLRLEWTGHLALPEAPGGEDGRSRIAGKGPARVTAETVRRAVEKLRVGAAEFIAPELPGGQLPEMSCIDPNRCVCVYRPGEELMPAGWATSPPRDNYQHRACRAGKAKRLWQREGSEGSGGCSKDRVEDGSSSTESEDTAHRAVFPRYSGAAGEAAVQVSLRRCESGHPACVELVYCSEIGVYNLSPHVHSPDVREAYTEHPRISWIQALDPDSYGATDDRLSYGITWCPNRGCRNYYRCLRRPFGTFSDLYWHRESSFSYRFSKMTRVYPR